MHHGRRQAEGGRMIQKAYLIIKEIAGSRFISCIVLLSVVLSVFAVGLYRIAGDSLTRYIHDRFATFIPPNTIRISTKQPRSQFLFEVEKPKTTIITDRMLRRIWDMGGITDRKSVVEGKR